MLRVKDGVNQIHIAEASESSRKRAPPHRSKRHRDLCMQLAIRSQASVCGPHSVQSGQIESSSRERGQGKPNKSKGVARFRKAAGWPAEYTVRNQMLCSYQMYEIHGGTNGKFI
jgi:hypothetical protein